jgi:hypothetical protein
MYPVAVLDGGWHAGWEAACMLLATARAIFDLQAVLFYLQKLRGGGQKPGGALSLCLAWYFPGSGRNCIFAQLSGVQQDVSP